MEAAPVCPLVDAMFRLPAKLDGLLTRHGHMLPKGAGSEIPLIKRDLEKMIAILQEHDDSRSEDCATMVIKCLTKEVRELSYDMEDGIDQYEHAADPRARRGILLLLLPRRRKNKAARRRRSKTTEKLKWRLWMASKIREFSVRSQEALQRYSSLFNGLSGLAISGTAAASFGAWHPTHPVGIDAPMNKLEAWLVKDGEQKLKVVSVVGCGGVGKTTLASELYRRIGGQFECRAFVRTSQKPDVRRLLISVLSQVRPRQAPRTWKVHNLIAHIRTHLQDKRYLIVIDDVWTTSTWDIVKCALPDGNFSGAILITTEVEDVALRCCGYDPKYVFTMKPLGENDSSKLFFNTAFGPHHECPPELSEVIIRKCGGLPLAVVSVASLLASRTGNPEQWDYVNKSLGYGLRTNPTLEGMKQVLNLTYTNLAPHLKACMLYFSIYEEDYIIWKDDLAKQWIAEGFICATEDKDKEEISRSYFDELISSRMIRPVHVNDNDDVLSCTVHRMVLDFITHKSIEENFATAIGHCQTTARLADKVRRLSLHFGNAEATAPTNMRLSQVRTLAYFGVSKCVPSIVEFRLLQVLILHLWGDEESISFDLTRISELFRLRYLHVTCNVTLEVQGTQMRGLQYLETLKIDARVSAVPSDIVHLPGLLHLSLPVETDLPNGIGHMTSLRTLGYFDLSVNSVNNVQSLGELTNLRDLQLTCSTVPCGYPESKMDSLGSILAKLSNLKSLTLEPSGILDVGPSSMCISYNGLSSVSPPPVLLQRLEWSPRICSFSSLPKWIGHLGKLCILKIGVMELARNDVDALRGLPALTALSLYVRTKPVEMIVFSKTGFSVLKYFKFRCTVPWLKFEVGAVPNLRKLKLGFDAHGADQHGTTPVGIEHLSGLQEICAKIGGAGLDDPDRSAAESALTHAIMMHPARPNFNIQCLDQMFSGKEDKNSGVQEEEHMTLQNQCEIMEEGSIEHHGVLQEVSRECAHSRFSAFSEWKTAVDKRADRRCRIEEMTGLSSSSRWTTWLKTEALKEASRNLPKRYEIMGEDSNELHGVLQKDYRKALPKGSATVVKISMNAKDSFSWRKYGQKSILNTNHPRCYYRCLHHRTQGCQARKHVQRQDSDKELFLVKYVGSHTCAQGLQPQPGQEKSSVSVGVKGEGSVQGLEHMPLRKTLPKWSMQVRTASAEDTQALDDGFSWRKYGQKVYLGAMYPRSYYRCVHSRSDGCPAIKQVQRTDGDPLLFDVMYVGGHTCAQGAHSVPRPAQEQSSASVGFTTPRFMSPATSGSQITYEAVTGSTDTRWSATTNSPMVDVLDQNADFVDDLGYSDSDQTP